MSSTSTKPRGRYWPTAPTVRKLNDWEDHCFTLVTNDHEIDAILKHVGSKAECGCLLVEVKNGDYAAVYGLASIVPDLDARTERLYPPQRNY